MLKSPIIKTILPGPRAVEYLQKDRTYVSPSYNRIYPLVAEEGRGGWIRDVDGNVFLDFTAGIAVCQTGHCHPKVIEAVKDQAERLLHMSGADFCYPPLIVLAEKLSSLMPGEENKKVFFGNSGTEAVEGAFKLARWHTQRKLNIAFYGGFHGRTMGSLSLTASKNVQKKHYDPFVPGVTHVPYAYCYRCDYNLSYPECGLECVRWIEDSLFQTTIFPEDVAALIIEPIQGEGGYIVPPAEYHKELYALAKKYGILFVVDEVQSGMGRTGKMFAIEHFGVLPDIIAVAKGIASGMPLGAIIARSEIMDWETGSHSTTFGGNPLACRAALVTIELLEQTLMANANAQGNLLLSGLRTLQKSYEPIGDVRGKGLMAAIELVKDRQTKKHHEKLRDDIVQSAFRKGLLLLGCGKSSIRFCPALTVSAQEIEVCLSIFNDVLRELSG
jgi:4-aminobutyrate aminotransferase